MSKLYELARDTAEKRTKHIPSSTEKEIYKVMFEEGFTSGAKMVRNAMLDQLDKLFELHKVDDYIGVRERITEMIFNLEELTYNKEEEYKQ